MGKTSKKNKKVYNAFDLIEFAWEKKYILTGMTVIAAILSVVISLQMTDRFRSTVVLFPAASVSIAKNLVETSSISMDSRDIMSFGKEEDAERMLQILHSNQIKDYIVQKYNLMEHYDIDINKDKFPYTKLDIKYKGNIKFRRTEFQSIEISVLDGVLSAKYSLSLAVKSAKILNIDPDLVEKWQAIEKKLLIPQNDTTYLEFPDDKQDREGGGYHGIRAPVWFGFPASENIVKLDKEKAFNALDNAWVRNSGTQGMISFISNWFALSELYLNRPDKALNYLKNNIVCFDDAEISIGETGGYDGYHNPYFLTSYASYILAPVSMLVQSYSNQINPFPAIPTGWKNIEFYDLPAENGSRVSGVYKNGEIQYVEFLKNSKVDIMGKYQEGIEGTRPDEK